MASWLTEVFDHLIGPMDVEVWIEPFGGGAGAALMALEAHEVPEVHPLGKGAWWAIA